MSPVVVVGAGVGGLCAAIDLAAAGRDVTVLEAGPRPGGKANVVVVDGVEADTGPSVLTMPHVFDALFRRAGTCLADELTILEASPACRYAWPDGLSVDIFHDRERTRASVAQALGSDASRQLDAFLDHAERIWDAAAPWFVEGDAPTPGRVMGLGPRAWLATTRIDAFRTMERGIGRFVREPHLAAILHRYATYNGSDPRRAPSTLNCIAHVELGLGVYAIEGGMYELVRALVRVAERLGVVIACDTPVSEVLLEGSTVRGVRTHDGTAHAAGAVVVNADASHLVHDLLPEGTSSGLDPEPEPSMSGWVGILRQRRLEHRVGHTVLFPDRAYLDEFVDIFDHDRPPTRPTVYLCAQGTNHRRAGWPDHEPVFVMANAPAEPRTGASDPSRWPPLREAVLARLRDAGLWSDDDAVLWTRTPTELATTFPGTRGAIYGSSSNDLFAAFRRPPNALRRVPGLFLASGSAHPGGGVPLCALSGAAAARAVLRSARGRG